MSTPAGTTHRRTLRWQNARVLSVRDETPTARTYRLLLPEPRRHLAGQHYVLRLTAPDGYSAARSYSVASAPDDTGEIELTVERLVDGEVSEFVHDVVVPGDELEVRGPIGLFFVWPGDRPALLVGGGSGVVPLALPALPPLPALPALSPSLNPTDVSHWYLLADRRDRFEHALFSARAPPLV